MYGLFEVWWSICCGSFAKRLVIVSLLLLSVLILMIAFNFVSIGVLFIFAANDLTTINLAGFESINSKQGRLLLIGSGLFILFSTWVLARAILLMIVGLIVAIASPEYRCYFGACLKA